MALASAWLVNAQNSVDGDSYHPHAAFAFVRTGERTPTLRNDTQRLTALGANQMYTLGQNFRTRYISGDKPNTLGVQHIAGMSADILNNDQVWVQTRKAPYLVSSAQAFMQGLYPPHGIANGTGHVTDILTDGTSIDYPLNGYQYANIQVASPADPDSRYISGDLDCPAAQKAALMYFTTDEFEQTRTANKELYQSLKLDWFEGHMNAFNLDYINALEIADYMSYQYTHNSTVHDMFVNDTQYTGVYDKLRYLADEEAWHLYGNTSSSDTDADNQAIGGKTLAASILSSFSLRIANPKNILEIAPPAYPLMFYFGEQDAMMSLISLMMLDSKSPHFKSIPPYASAMVFELFSRGSSAAFPSDASDLWVRFSFHNGTDSTAEQLTQYPMFNNGPSTADVPWPEFENMFGKIAMKSIAEWCNSCSSPSIFCSGVEGGDTMNVASGMQEKGKKKDGISAVVGGAIGAIVALVVAGLFFALTMLLGGIRFRRVQRIESTNKTSPFGGFKGSAKLASDPDLSLSGNGALPAKGAVEASKGHERVGSWELAQKQSGKDANDASPRSSFDAIDAVATGRPVQAHEGV
ncbi:Histidine phosphatase superfamily clade-2 [Pyrenophora seminiperda CCB06]|uniref:Histidine phosphatase superfamily clade-2 n=1 Tax=Pyrenophora seminiperda CCB06 TaxID=1302712 RepID=A0A3M7M3C3_9PLEO|nr:Histidine phosphatase superfamily clade-2 [Pyrenophora seminiperda CCB06]